MAGSGEFSRVGNTRSLNSNLGSAITGGTICPGADLVGALSATFNGAGQTSIATAASGGGAVLTKAIPDDAVLIIADAAGAVDTMEMVIVNGAAAISAVSVTIDSMTTRVSHAAGSGVWLFAFKPYLALVLSATAPTDNGLGTEYAQSGYARQPIPWTVPTAADPPVAANQLSTTFTITGGNGSDIVSYCSLRDSLSGGTAPNQYAWWTFATTITPPSGSSSINIAIGALTMQCFH
jgi:hypothetical protein